MTSENTMRRAMARPAAEAAQLVLPGLPFSEAKPSASESRAPALTRHAIDCLREAERSPLYRRGHVWARGAGARRFSLEVVQRLRLAGLLVYHWRNPACLVPSPAGRATLRMLG